MLQYYATVATEHAGYVLFRALIIKRDCAGAASSGDIDMLLGHPDYTSGSKSKPPYIKSIVGAMEEDGFVTDTLSAGESKFMVRGTPL